MVEKIFKDYKENLSGYGLVFKYMKLQYNLFRITPIVFLLVVILIIVSGISRKYTDYAGILLLSFIIYTAAVFVVFNSKAQKVVASKYGVNAKGFIWNSNEYLEVRRKKLRKYLEEQNLFNRKKLETLILLNDKKLEQSKPRPFLLPGLLIAFIIP